VSITNNDLEELLDDKSQPDLIKEMALELLLRRESQRRYLITKMAVNGEFSGIARQLQLWDIKPLQ
jgi:hypothetical protein